METIPLFSNKHIVLGVCGGMADKYGIDTRRIYLIGQSAGGHMVSLAATLGAVGGLRWPMAYAVLGIGGAAVLAAWWRLGRSA